MHYFLVNKPYGMLSQFTREEKHHQVLSDLSAFPKTVYPVGRLDRDSEGLLILTDDKELHTKLLHPKRGHKRTYWVQVEGIPSDTALQQLREGVDIRAKKQQYRTLASEVAMLATAPIANPRNPPIRIRQSVPDSWLELTLTEGKNRQVRRMCAAVGYPVLRLLRGRIEGLTLEHLVEEPVKELSKKEMYKGLGWSH